MPPRRKRGGKVSNGNRKRAKGTKDARARVKNEAKGSTTENEQSKKLEEMNVEALSAKYLIQKVSLSRAHMKKSKINCQQCTKIFRYMPNYRKHLENEHSNLPDSVQCGQCPVRCPNNAVLQTHIEEIHKRETFECPDCKKKFVRSAHVLRHMAQKGCSGTKTTVYPCEICCAQFTRKDNLMVHLRLQHITSRKFACKECPYSTGTFSKLVIHRQKYHTDGKGQQFQCDHCNKVVTSRAAICKHLEIHGDKKFACDVCGYSTYTIEVMRRHVLTHVREKPYKCKMCERSFIQRSQLIKHEERHFQKNCNICGEQFTSKNNLLLHMQTKHIKTKLGRQIEKSARSETPTCDVCGKEFQYVAVLRKHMMSHTLERPRRCMYCVVARAYVRGEQLVKHVRKMHPQVFKDHLLHVRQVLNPSTTQSTRVTKSEMDAVLNVMDAEAERIIQGYGEGVLYGGMQEPDNVLAVEASAPDNQPEFNPLMSEEELANNLNQLLVQLIDKDLLECFGWPLESVDTVLEKVIENCGARPADREKWTRVQRLRENAKHLFLFVLDDKNIARMLDSHTIDQVIKHILAQVSSDGDGGLLVHQNIRTDQVVENILPLA